MLLKSMIKSASAVRVATVAAGLALVPGLALAQNGVKEAGVWIDDTGKGAVEIFPCGAKLCGKIVWLMEPLNAKGEPKHDIYNPNPEKRTRTICGLQVLGELARMPEGGYDGGWVYDPKVGKSYSSAIQLANANTLTVTGYAGMKFLGKTFNWTRAPAEQPRCDPNGSAAQPAAPSPQGAAPAAKVAPAAAAKPHPAQQPAAPAQKATAAPAEAPAKAAAPAAAKPAAAPVASKPKTETAAKPQATAPATAPAAKPATAATAKPAAKTPPAAVKAKTAAPAAPAAGSTPQKPAKAVAGTAAPAAAATSKPAPATTSAKAQPAQQPAAAKPAQAGAASSQAATPAAKAKTATPAQPAAAKAAVQPAAAAATTPAPPKKTPAKTANSNESQSPIVAIPGLQ